MNETPIQRDRVWVRIAGNAKRIREGGQEGWRGFLYDGRPDPLMPSDEILLKHWVVSGDATGGNFIPGVHQFQTSSEQPALVAWIDLFGNVSVDGAVARIELLSDQ